MMNEEITKERVTKQVNLFSKFLAASLPCVDNLMEHHDWENHGFFSINWMQVNWEFLVEFQLLGEGKYLTPLWSRITNKNANPDYAIVTIIEKDVFNLRNDQLLPKNYPLTIRGFSTALKPKSFGFYPPFDLVTLRLIDQEKVFFTVPLKELEFQLLKVD